MDDQFDICECFSSHEFAMQRLLNFIRQNQNECTDTQCIDVTGRLMQNTPSTTDCEDNFGMILMVFFGILALLMQLIRPESIMKLANIKRAGQGPYDGHNGRSNQPPPPPSPPAIN